MRYPALLAMFCFASASCPTVDAGGTLPAFTEWTSADIGAPTSTATTPGGTTGIALSIQSNAEGFSSGGDSATVFHHVAELGSGTLDVRLKLHATPVPGPGVDPNEVETGLLVLDDASNGTPFLFFGIDGNGDGVIRYRKDRNGEISVIEASNTVSDTIRFVAGYDAVYLYRSNDGGASWISLGGFPISFVESEPLAGVCVFNGSAEVTDLSSLRLPLFFEVTKDEDEATFVGEWTSAEDEDSWGGDQFASHQDLGAAPSAAFNLTPPLTGSYEIFLRWLPVSGSSNQTPVNVVHSGLEHPGLLLTSPLEIDQSGGAGLWVSLGTYWLDRDAFGQQLTILAALSEQEGVPAPIALDALRLVKGLSPEPILWEGLSYAIPDYSGGQTGSAVRSILLRDPYDGNPLDEGIELDGDGNPYVTIGPARAFGTRLLHGDGVFQFSSNYRRRGRLVDPVENRVFEFPTFPFQGEETLSFQRSGETLRLLSNGSSVQTIDAVGTNPLLIDVSMDIAWGSPGQQGQGISEAFILGGVKSGNADEDSLPDDWEFAIVMDVNAPGRGVFSIIDVRAEDDYDGDGRTNFEELQEWSDPTDPDDLWRFKVALFDTSDGYFDDLNSENLGSGVRRLRIGTDWNIVAKERRIISGDGAMQFSVSDTSSQIIVGLDPIPVPDPLAPQTSWTLKFSSGGVIASTGALAPADSQTIGTYVAGDKFMISRKSDVVNYWKNGVLLETFPLDPVQAAAVLTPSVKVESPTSEPAVSGVLVAGGMLARDSDEDGLFDDYENGILSADPDDSLIQLSDVKPEDDFNSNGRSNFVDQFHVHSGDTLVSQVKWSGLDGVVENNAFGASGIRKTNPSDGWDSFATSSQRIGFSSLGSGTTTGTLAFSIGAPGNFVLGITGEDNLNQGFPNHFAFGLTFNHEGSFFFSSGNITAGAGVGELSSSEIVGSNRYVEGDRFEIRLTKTSEEDPISGNGSTIEVYRFEVHKNGVHVGSRITSETSLNFGPLAYFRSPSSRPSIWEVRIGRIFNDTDADGLPDGWEIQIVYDDDTDGITEVVQVLPGGDFDGDGRSNYTEFLDGTNPTNLNDFRTFEPVFWTAMQFTDEAADLGYLRSALRKVTGGSQWPGGAMSGQILNETTGKKLVKPVGVRFRVEELAAFKAGLVAAGKIGGWAAPDLFLDFSPAGTFRVIKDGLPQALVGGAGDRYEVGDRFTIDLREHTTASVSSVYHLATIRRNGDVVFTLNLTISGFPQQRFAVVISNESGMPSISEASISTQKTESPLPSDNDNDGLPDSWELSRFVQVPGSGYATIEEVIGSDDSDNDGRTNYQEYLDWSDPLDPTDKKSWKPVKWGRMFYTVEDGYLDRSLESPLRTTLRGELMGGQFYKAFAVGLRAVEEDGGYRFRIESPSNLKIGAHDSYEEPPGVTEDFDLISFFTNGTFEIRNPSGKLFPANGAIAYYEPGDEFSIEREDGLVKVVHNREVIASFSSLSPSRIWCSVRVNNASISPQISGVREYGAVMLGDLDEDGLPDSWEQQIIDADTADGLTSFETVRFDDDFDGDGVTNGTEYLDATSPIDALARFRALDWKDEVLTLAEYPAEGTRFESGSSLSKSGGAEAWGVSTAHSRHTLLGDGTLQFSLAAVQKRVRLDLFKVGDLSGHPALSIQFGGNGTTLVDEVRIEGIPGTGVTKPVSETDVFEVKRVGSSIQVSVYSASDGYKTPVTLFNWTLSSFVGELTVKADLHSQDAGIKYVRSFGFSDPLDRDGDGIPDAEEQTFLDSDPEDQFETLSDVNLDSDIDGDGRTAGEDLRYGPDHFSKHPDFKLGSNGRTTQVDLPTSVANDPIRSLGGSFSVEPSGAATYSIPIPLPPGTAGLAPSLSLNYSSHSGNGALGIGWALGGLTSITRGGSDFLHDGLLDPLDGDAADRFYFGGSRLVLVSGTYGSDGSEYRTEGEQFSRFIYRKPGNSGGSWQVFQRSGLILSFGTSADSNIQREVGTTPTTVAWALHRVEDRSGNYYEVSYSAEKDGDHVLEFVPAEIRYTGNLHAGIQPYTTVSFLYDERANDPVEGFFPASLSGKKSVRRQRLREIKTETGEFVNRRLVFTYESSPATVESRLVSVREYAGDGSTYAPTRFLWEKQATGWARSESWSSTSLSDPKFGDKGRQLVDLNGDGLVDLIGSHAVDYDTTDTVVALNNGKTFVPSDSYALPSGVFLSSESPNPTNVNLVEFGGTGAMLVDLNGDALPDLVSNGRFHWYEYQISNETRGNALPESLWTVSDWPRKRFNQDVTYHFWKAVNHSSGLGGKEWYYASYTAKKSVQRPNGTWPESAYPPARRDVTAPIGKFVVTYKENARGVWLNTGNGWSPSAEYGGIADSGSPFYLQLGDSEKPDLGVRFVDLDGDGLMDLIRAHDSVGGKKVFRNTGHGWEDLSGGNWRLPTDLATGDGTESLGRQLVDMNGDGLIDIVTGLATGGNYGSHTFESKIWLNTGSGWQLSDWQLPTWIADHTGELCGRALQDLNGDGLPDLILSITGNLIARPYGGSSEVWLNTGSGWEPGDSFRLPQALVHIEQDGTSRPLGRIFSDVNGDGLVDFVSVGETSSRGVWLNTGRGWTAKDPRWSVPDGFSVNNGVLAEATSSFQLADIDGDALPDFIDRTGTGTSSGIWLNRCSPDRISRFLAPLSDPIQVSYARMNDTARRAETGKPIHQMGKTARYPHVDAQTPLGLVSKVTRTDDKGRDQATVYSYGGLRFDQRGRGPQGFKWMESTDLLRGFSTYTEFLQDYPYTGLVSYTENRLPDGRPLARTRNHYSELPEKGGLPNGGGTIVHPYLRSSIASTFAVDSAGAEHYHTGTVRSVFGIDNWGNLRSSRADFYTTTDTEGATPLKSTITVNEYEQENPAAWLIGRATRTTTTVVSHETDLVGSDTITRTSTTQYHPSTGLPVVQINLPGSSLSSRVDIQHDLFGNVKRTVKTAAGSTRQVVQETFYDHTGRFAERTVNGLGHSVSIKFDPERAVPLYSYDANGLRTDFDHDVWGDLLRSRFADGTASVSARKWLNRSQIPGAIFYTYRQSSGTTPAIAYHDRYGRVLVTESIGFQGAGSAYAETLYDRYGRAAAVSDPYFGNGSRKYWKTSKYDLLDRLVAVTGPDGRTSRTTSLGFTSIAVNPVGQTTTTVSDWFGRTVSVTDAGGTTKFRHDVDGNIARTTDVSGNVIKADFNLLGLRTFFDDPHAGSTTTDYNGFGEVLTNSDNLGNETSFTYDLLGRVATRTTPEANTVYTYDTAPGKGKGKLHRIDLTPLGGSNGYHPHGSGYVEIHEYDQYGRSTGTQFTVEGITYGTSQSYDGLGRPDISVNAGGFATRINYNANGNAYEVVRLDTGAVLSRTNSVDAYGRTISTTAGNGVETHRAFNPFTGFLTHLGASKSNAQGTSITPIQRFQYGYDDIGNLLTRTDDRLSGTDPTETFTYDGSNRIETATVTGSAAQVFNYTPTGGGNFASRDGISDYRYTDPSRPHRLKSAVDASNTERVYEYDNRGRITLETREANGGAAVAWRDYSWTSFGMPRIINHYQSPVLEEGSVGGFPGVRGLAQARFTYDAQFSRTSQILMKGGRIVRTLYLGSYELTETREYQSTVSFENMPLLERERKHHFGSGVYRIVETSTDGGVSTTTEASTLFFHGDLLGSVSAITDAAGDLVERTSFDSFGKRRNGTDWSPDPGDGESSTTAKSTGTNTTRGYTGHEQLDHFGLIHMNGRIYDPEIGRFLSPDPLVAMPGNSQSYNRYAYVLNNPHRYTDPSGYAPNSLIIGYPSHPQIIGWDDPGGTGNAFPIYSPSGWQSSLEHGPNGYSSSQFPGGRQYSISPLAALSIPGHVDFLLQQDQQALRRAAIADVNRFRREQRAEIRDYNQGTRKASQVVPFKARTVTQSGLVVSSVDSSQPVYVVESRSPYEIAFNARTCMDCHGNAEVLRRGFMPYDMAWYDRDSVTPIYKGTAIGIGAGVVVVGGAALWAWGGSSVFYWSMANPVTSRTIGAAGVELAWGISTGMPNPSTSVISGVPSLVGAVDDLAATTAGSIRTINPSGNGLNCVECVIAMEQRFAGAGLAVAKPTSGPLPITLISDEFGGAFEPAAGMIDIGMRLSRAGDGARGIVYGADNARGFGHVWNVRYDKGVLRFLDGQSGGLGVGNFDDFTDFQFLLTAPGKR